MRTFVLLPIAAAALATAAIGAWGLAPAGSPGAVFAQEPAATTVNRHAASETIVPATPRAAATPSWHFRAETCGGDYVCREDGAWEPAAVMPAGARPLTSDGF